VNVKRFLLIAVCLAGALVATQAHAQLMFHTTFDQYEHPKSQWQRWAKTKPGDFIEFSDGMKVFARFEAVEVGDHVMKIRTTVWNELLPKPEQRDIRHVFNQEEPKFGLPTSVSDDKLKLGDQEFATRKEQFLGFDKQPVKEVWFSDDAPFDGLLKYQQYTLGKASAERVAARFRKGDVTFGKADPDPKPAPAEDPKPKPKPTQPAPPPSTTPDPPAPADDAVRTWTSADGKQTIEAEFVRATATGVVLKRKSDGKTFNLTLKQLSQADRDYVKELRKSKDKGKQ
jgi:hypothetical protein